MGRPFITFIHHVRPGQETTECGKALTDIYESSRYRRKVTCDICLVTPPPSHHHLRKRIMDIRQKIRNEAVAETEARRYRLLLGGRA